MRRTTAVSPLSLGSILRDKRKSMGLNQADTGKKVGIDQPTLSKVERGKSSVRLDTLFRVLAALDLELMVGDRSKEIESGNNDGDNW